MLLMREKGWGSVDSVHGLLIAIRRTAAAKMKLKESEYVEDLAHFFAVEFPPRKKRSVPALIRKIIVAALCCVWSIRLRSDEPMLASAT
jgi:hypothetical protein